ncbi:MAG: NAD(P)H-dependent oxidoreductase subunit E [Chloroflexi bacterium]|nr:NAD(P)H-dependent oxidoreductase subunit E [Chloroflexota bacterium]
MSSEDIVERLTEIQSRLGFIPRAQVEELARELRMPPARVFGAATFYSMLSIRAHGAHVVRFCEDAPCHIAGGREVYDAIRSTLGVEPGGTSEDGQWTFEMTSCLGLCGVAPVMMVDDDVYGNLTPERAAEILARTQ